MARYIVAIVAGAVVGSATSLMLLALDAPPDPFWWNVWTLIACPAIGFVSATLVLRWMFR